MNIDSEYAEVLAGRCIVVSIMITALVTAFMWGNWIMIGLLWVIGMPIMTLVFGYLTGFFFSAMGATQDNQLWFDESGSLVVERSAEIIGTFNGALIHEWVMLKRPDNEELIKCTYERTIDVREEELDLPNNQWFVIEDGVLYVSDPDPEIIIIPPTASI